MVRPVQYNSCMEASMEHSTATLESSRDPRLAPVSHAPMLAKLGAFFGGYVLVALLVTGCAGSRVPSGTYPTAAETYDCDTDFDCESKHGDMY